MVDATTMAAPMATDTESTESTPDAGVDVERLDALRALAAERRAALDSANVINAKTRKAVFEAEVAEVPRAVLAMIFDVQRQQIHTWVMRERALAEESDG